MDRSFSNYNERKLTSILREGIHQIPNECFILKICKEGLLQEKKFTILLSSRNSKEGTGNYNFHLDQFYKLIKENIEQ